MNYHAYESRITYIIIAILICIQIGVFVALRTNNHAAVQATIKEELTTGTHVFNRLIELRSRQLQQASEILCGDFGFRESIATRDKTTIESMLSNHSARADASISILTGLDQQVIATSPSKIELDSNLIQQIAPVDSAKKQILNFIPLNLSSHSRVYDDISSKVKSDEIYQLINTQILSPLHSATLTLGFPINNAYAQELKTLIGMDFLFFSQENGIWQLHASTINAFDAQLFTPLNLHTRQINTKTEQYLSKPILLQSTSNKVVIAVAAKPMRKLMQPFQQFETTLIYLLVITILLSAFAIYMVTNKMVRPLNDLAHQDNLTGLGNRRLFTLSLDNAINELNTLSKPFTLMILDLDKFKLINDTKGHDAGDVVLQATALRLKETLRDTDTVIRLGGDEFAVIVHEVNQPSIQAIAEKISAAISQPIKLGDNFVIIGASIGIATAPSDANTQFDLIKKADEAMYIAKIQHKNFQFYANL